jgi:dUTP pyrophosphatase
MYNLEIELVATSKELIPKYESKHASGVDLKSRIDFILQPGAAYVIPTGLRMSIPDGFEMQVRPKSGLAAKKGITVLNAPGTVDADFRGEVCVILINHGKEPFTVQTGMKIAQGVFCPIAKSTFIIVDQLDETERGEGGFGSTGV